MVKLSEKIFGYARVSSKEQNLDRQLDALKKYVPDESDIITEKMSGKNFERPEYKKLRMMMREGDILYLVSLDRLGRNKFEVKQELENLRAMGVTVRIMDIPTSMIDYNQFGEMQKPIMEMVNTIIIEVLSTMAESERRVIKKRQAEGIAAAKRRGKHMGRPRLEFPINWVAVYRKWRMKEITAVSAMQELGLKRASFYNLVKRYEASIER